MCTQAAGRQLHLSSGGGRGGYRTRASLFLPRHEAINVPLSKAWRPAAVQRRSCVREPWSGMKSSHPSNLRQQRAGVWREEMDFLDIGFLIVDFFSALFYLFIYLTSMIGSCSEFTAHFFPYDSRATEQ